jgi:hypothetical protein
VRRKIKFTPTADRQYSDLENGPSRAETFERVRKAIGHLEIDPHHLSLSTHEFTSLAGVNGERIFEAYAQNKTPGAYRIFWHYGPDETKAKKRIPVITVVAITPHP